MERHKVVFIARAGDSTSVLYNALSSRFEVEVLFEKAPSAWTLIRSRMRRLGIFRVIGQLLFHSLVALPMSWSSQKRRREILAEHRASNAPPPLNRIRYISSVNTEKTWSLVHSLSPQVVVINGTRILSKATLGAFGVPVLNTHVGITPPYRGVHGAYWALVNRDPEHCGVTVHLVDQGIDTGGILRQAKIKPTKQDDFSTYPTMQMAIGAKLLCQAVEEAAQGTSNTIPGPEGSNRWYHPTILEYLSNRIRKGVR